jgi:MFS transporter, ACS family, D-galactonate transporter
MSQPAPSMPMSNPNPQERPTWVRWQIVGLLVGYSFMTWFNRLCMPAAYDEKIKSQYGISPEAMGYVYSAFLCAYMLCMTPGGWLIDRFGTRTSLAIMGFGSAAFCALTATAGISALDAGFLFTALLVIRSIMGILSAPVYPAASRVVSHWIPVSQRAWANGLVQAAAAIGMACTFPVFGALMDWFGWQCAFVIAGAVTAALALVWTMYAANYPAEHRHVNEAERRHIAGAAPLAADWGQGAGVAGEVSDVGLEIAQSPSWHALLRDRSLMLLTISYGAVGYIEYLFFFWMHYYFEKVLKLGESQSRLYASILYLALAGGMLLGGAAAVYLHRIYGKQRGRAMIPVTGMLVGAVFLILGVLATEIVWIVLWLSLALAAVGAAEAPIWTLAVELGGSHGGTAAAICNTGGNAGGLVAPILTPLVSGWISRQFGVSEQAGWQWGISLGGLIGVLGAALWLWITPGEDLAPSRADAKLKTPA